MHESSECKFCSEIMNDDRKRPLKEISTGPSFEPVQSNPRREFDSIDFRRTRIPLAYRDASVDKIQDLDVRQVVETYIKNVKEMVKSCTGLLLVGDPGTGKSACAALIGMEATRCGLAVFVVTHAELQELRFDKPHEDEDGSTAMSRVRSTDLLIIDNVNEDFLNDKVFGPAKMEKLVAARNGARRTTIFTTRYQVSDFTKEASLKSLYGVMQETMVGAVIEGVDLRQVRNLEMKRKLGLIK